MSSVVDVEKRLMALIVDHESYEEGSEKLVKKLTNPIINDVRSALKLKKFDQTAQQLLFKNISNLMLYKAFFETELMEKIFYDAELEIDVSAKIPIDVRNDEDMMRRLEMIARRIEHMQMPRYQSLKRTLVDIIKHYMRSEQEVDT